MRFLAYLVLAAAAGLAAPSHAAPVATAATLTVHLDFRGIAMPSFTFGGVGHVDVTGNTVSVPAGLVSLSETIVIPVTGTTASGFTPFTVMTLSNLSGTFSVGGVTNQLPGEVCAGGPGLREACNAGGGVGGRMGMTGSIFWPFGFIPLPFVDFDDDRVGQGGSTNNPFSLDAAAWSTGQGFVGLPTGATMRAGGAVPFNVVTPTYIDFLGVDAVVWTSLTLTAVSLPVPEPSFAILLAAILAGLLWKGR